MEDQDFLDMAALSAMPICCVTLSDPDDLQKDVEECWRIAIAMKQARDRIFTTAKPAQPDPGPFPKIEME